jgi:hypothetical protein
MTSSAGTQAALAASETALVVVVVDSDVVEDSGLGWPEPESGRVRQRRYYHGRRRSRPL